MLLRISTRWWTIPTCALAVVAMLAASPNDDDPMSDDVESMSAFSRSNQDLRNEFARRIEIKAEIIRQLTCGEITFHEATSQFLLLNQEIPTVMDAVRFTYPGATDEEKTAVNVIEYVTLSNLPEDLRTAMTERFRQDFATRYGHAPQLR